MNKNNNKHNKNQSQNNNPRPVMENTVTTQDLTNREDRSSVHTRISWGAIAAGVALALSIQFLLGILGAATGLSISDKVTGTTLQNGAMIWAVLTTITALFVGGVVVSLLTAGENKMEAFLSGVVMWAVFFAVLVFLGTAGVRGGITALAGISDATRTANAPAWDVAAREAGVSDAQINEWRQKTNQVAEQARDPQTQKEAADAATRVTWYAFFAAWVSMIAAAGGAILGAGPTFRVINVAGSRRIITSGADTHATSSVPVGSY